MITSPLIELKTLGPTKLFWAPIPYIHEVSSNSEVPGTRSAIRYGVNSSDMKYLSSTEPADSICRRINYIVASIAQGCPTDDLLDTGPYSVPAKYLDPDYDGWPTLRQLWDTLSESLDRPREEAPEVLVSLFNWV